METVELQHEKDYNLCTGSSATPSSFAKGTCFMLFYVLLLLVLPLGSILQSVAQKQYSLQHKASNVFLFSTLTTVFALCFILLSSGFQLDFIPALFPYALAFALAYALGWVSALKAVQLGSLALTSLIGSFSLIFPTLYGLLRGETLTVPVAIGMVLLVTAIVLVNAPSKAGFAFSPKWLMWALVPFVTNGVCTVSQTMSKQALGDAYSHEFMVIALSVAAVILFVITFLRKCTRLEFRVCLPYALANGLANALMNFLIMVLIGNIPNTVLFPTKSALSIAAAFLLAFFVYRERFSKIQYIGYALGAASVVLLNL